MTDCLPEPPEPASVSLAPLQVITFRTTLLQKRIYASITNSYLLIPKFSLLNHAQQLFRQGSLAVELRRLFLATHPLWPAWLAPRTSAIFLRYASISLIAFYCLTQVNLLQSEVDIGLEDEVARNPYSVKSWLAYTEAKALAAPQVRYNVYERALRLMPGSYKLWVAYLEDRHRQVWDTDEAKRLHVAHLVPPVQLRTLRIDDSQYEITNNAYERAMVTMHKMPVVWYVNVCGNCFTELSAAFSFVQGDVPEAFDCTKIHH